MDISYSEIVREGIGQMRKPVRGLPSRLYLTEEKLYHAGEDPGEGILTEIYLEGIAEAVPAMSLLVVPNRIKIITKDGDVFLFVVFKRDGWLEDINRLLGNSEHQNTNSVGRQDDYGKGF
ncbi:hypothetical protein WN59_13125 [Salinicoccus sediminis]|uniref:GRAM domain-containing protein n=1 Tax=Salinicoccus sediminis TaxID=1432562 RepID=A0A0M2SK72_9STAP|nr:hypothetical protein [Salinicoccus sediminis]KKK32975.1 hypothetical protein WN59_13125 [Salinicoccus sediminis]